MITPQKMKRKYIYIVCMVLAAGVLYQCTSHKQVAATPPQTAYNPPKADPNSSPVVPADESISKMKLEDGFSIKLIASEPLISTPIAMTFDNKGRIFEISLEDYLPDTRGNG
jgi:hypothetical protein